MSELTLARDFIDVIGVVPNPGEFAALPATGFTNSKSLPEVSGVLPFDPEYFNDVDQLGQRRMAILAPTLALMGQHALTHFAPNAANGAAELIINSSKVPKHQSQQEGGWHNHEDSINYLVASAFATEFPYREIKPLDIVCIGPETEHRSPVVPRKTNRVLVIAAIKFTAD